MSYVFMSSGLEFVVMTTAEFVMVCALLGNNPSWVNTESFHSPCMLTWVFILEGSVERYIIQCCKQLAYFWFHNDT